MVLTHLHNILEAGISVANLVNANGILHFLGFEIEPQGVAHQEVVLVCVCACFLHAVQLVDCGHVAMRSLAKDVGVLAVDIK